jgi:hypothetical protein
MIKFYFQDFERMNLRGYHLNKQGRFYYLYIDRAHATSMAHVHEISNALMCLENDADLTQETVVLPSHIISSPQVRAETEPPPQLTQDSSVVVLSTLGEDHEDKDNADKFRPEDIKISVIRPSPVKEVPRQSIEVDFEVREKLEDQVHMDLTDEFADRSSSSSIQVIDDKEGDAGLEFTARPDLQRQEALLESSAPDTPSDEVFKDNEGKLFKLPKEAEVRKMFDLDSSKKESPKDSPKDIQVAPRLADKGHCISIKRAHSSASFEKYKTERSKIFQTASVSEVSSTGTITPNRRSSVGLHTPSRMNAPSGLNTPLSTIGTQSRCSGCFDDGYEGDSSDSDEDGVMMSFSESAIQRPVLPNFWLIMCITDSLVDVFFHTR